MTKIKFSVFNDGLGNRFVFPGLHDHNGTTSDFFYKQTLCTLLKITEEPEYLEVDEDDDGTIHLRHVKADALHPNFEHGGEIVWIISGPEFDRS